MAQQVSPQEDRVRRQLCIRCVEKRHSWTSDTQMPLCYQCTIEAADLICSFERFELLVTESINLLNKPKRLEDLSFELSQAKRLLDRGVNLIRFARQIRRMRRK